MGEYMKKCERIRATEDVMWLNFSKKRKLYCELENEYAGDVELVQNASSPATSRTSCWYEYDESIEVGRRSSRSPDLENVDLQTKGFGMEISTSINGIFREAIPKGELSADSEEFMVMDSSSAPSKKSSLVAPTSYGKFPASVAKTPPAAELEEFFAAAEKYEQKRFAEKYNYDIVKDVPLEGRYQWVRLHH
ncbi:cyclin-dependent kinase inhibitor 7 [Sesamum indicum]|uniref:Cyclin-dependent kinase inhibitor n=1 Tax=Sesamum indicum TaxID=4182 RepID=A0A6I9UEH6_SESIN|nr:cyclin-dependent kinase inhibitor 7 [Sesamum indicum]